MVAGLVALYAGGIAWAGMTFLVDLGALVDINFHVQAVDDPSLPKVGLSPINLPGADVPRLVSGLAIQSISAITLLTPVGAVDVSSATPQPLHFVFHVDIGALGLK